MGLGRRVLVGFASLTPKLVVICFRFCYDFVTRWIEVTGADFRGLI